MNRKHWVVLTACCCLTLTALLTVAALLGWIPLFGSSRPRGGKPPGTVPTQLTAAAPPTQTTAQPLPTATADQVIAPGPLPFARVGVWEGRLAVYPPVGDVPERVFDVWLSSLPPAEQELLTRTIEVWDEGELARVLEDYTS